MSKLAMEEDYWNSSKVKGFDFGDDIGQLTETKRTMGRMHIDFDDDLVSCVDMDVIDWSENVIKARRPGNERGTIPDPAFRHQEKFNTGLRRGSTSSQTTPSSLFSLGQPARVSGATTPLDSQKRHSVTPVGSSQSISDMMDREQLSSSAPRDMDSLQAENARLTRLLHSGRICHAGTEETVWKMFKNQPYALEPFRCLRDKMNLLDHAVKLHDGNIITAILIYLKTSLRKEILFAELISRPTAVNHYVSLLRKQADERTLLELLTALGRTEEAALIEYKQHLTMRDPEKRLAFLKRCISLPFNSEDSMHIQNQYTLLDHQGIIEHNDKKVEAVGQLAIFKDHPRKASILFMPLVTTLFYCCFYHYGETEGTLSSPANLKKVFKISNKQYLWTALAARSQLHMWEDVNALLTSKGWFGGTKKKALIGFHRVVEIVSKSNAPFTMVNEFVGLVEDAETRLDLALKHKCHCVVIETLCQMKDQQQLREYRKQVEKNSPEEMMIVDALKNSVRPHTPSQTFGSEEDQISSMNRNLLITCGKEVKLGSS
uniref:Spermatogenesis-defective protein 39 homolog n=1 Tax=Eptatretus burgeri TaxID=7764 RepID=A0A8C4N8X2_EPTBU